MMIAMITDDTDDTNDDSDLYNLCVKRCLPCGRLGQKGLFMLDSYGERNTLHNCYETCIGDRSLMGSAILYIFVAFGTEACF